MASTPETSNYVYERADAQRSATLIQVGALMGSLACIALWATLQSPINTMRKDLKLVLASNIYDELPPKYAWVSAFGGTFRGIAADILWTRMETLKQEGKYYEAHQLAEWICTVQPRFPEVWVFQAWNMSYNISVGTKTSAERWQWVYNGIRLLRDQGIPNNERFIPLYHQLAWLWFHKVGAQMDDHHWAYKNHWASTMETLLGAPPLNATDAEGLAWFKPVAEAPVSREELLKAHPDVQPLIDAITAAGIDLDVRTNVDRVNHPLELSFFPTYTRWLEQEKLGDLAKPREPLEEDKALFAVLSEADPKALDPLLAWLRARVLREQYKMDPAYMLDMSNKLGTDEPLFVDWRTPWSQSLYWGFYGVEKGEERPGSLTNNEMNLDRIVLFSLQALVKRGRYLFQNNLDNPFASRLLPMPDTRYLEAMHRKYIELGEKHADPGEDVENRTTENLRSGHINFLHDGITALYIAGKEDQAREYLHYLLEYYPDPYTGEPKEQYLQGLEDFVRGEFSGIRDRYAETLMLINSFLQRGYLELAAGDADAFGRMLRFAEKTYEEYQRDKQTDPEGRRTMPAFDEIRAVALGNAMIDPVIPLVGRSMIWRREAVNIQKRIYGRLREFLASECERAGFDLEAAFPEPPDWQEEHEGATAADVIEAEQQRRKEEKKEQEQE